ncbi:MAG: hypothetical protein Q7S31_01975 [bacterium]|nr:hypothetical protein [bacterium]
MTVLKSEIKYAYSAEPIHLSDLFKTVAQATHTDPLDARNKVIRDLARGDLVWADAVHFVVKRRPV